MHNGAQWALTGFLYQVVGTLGMKAEALCTQQAPKSKDLETLVRAVGESNLFAELFGQDAVLIPAGVDPNTNCTLIQFKFSDQPAVRKIGKNELLKIVDTLASSLEDARKSGQVVGGCYLITNREVEQKAKNVLDTSKSQLKEAVDGGVSKKEKLPSLTILDKLPWTHWENRLKMYASSLGVDEQEAEDGIDRLVVGLMTQVAEKGTALVTMASMKEAFLRHPNARSLRLEEVLAIGNQALEDLLDHLNVKGPVIKRGLADEISKACLERALIVLHGLGGCGKTVGLCQWLLDITCPSAEHDRAFAAIAIADQVPRFWVHELLCGWQSLPLYVRSEEPIDKSLRRLQIANPDLPPPILFLGLDGLDEGAFTADQRQYVRDILRWFWKHDQISMLEKQRPQATLVVTYRKPEDLTGTWLMPNLSGFDQSDEDIFTIRVADFSSDELLLVTKGHSQEIHDRIAGRLHRVGVESPVLEDNAYWMPTPETSGPSLPSADEQIVDALRHPSMWRALLSLDSKTQLKVLGGQPKAVKQMADAFIRWFWKRAQRRNLGIDYDRALIALQAIAHHQPHSKGSLEFKTDWVDPALKTSCIIDIEARDLHTEALLSGLIQKEDGPRWRWRHMLVHSYLAGVEVF